MWDRLQGDLGARWIIVKGILFLILGALAAAILLFECFSLRNTFLLVVAIWGFCRFYYFAFYVIQHYIDGSYRFSGLMSAARHLWRNRNPKV